MLSSISVDTIQLRLTQVGRLNAYTYLTFVVADLALIDQAVQWLERLVVAELDKGKVKTLVLKS